MQDIESNPNESKPQALLIDDCIDVHRLLSARLRGEQLRLLCASNGEDGLRLAFEMRPAIILLDLDMPEMDGFEVLRRLKEDAVTLSIPVIVLSGLHSPQDKVTAFELGAVDYITKPFDMTELRVRVRSAMRIHTLLTMLARRAQIDGLTGLWNRSYFDKRWAEEVAAAQRHRRALSIALLDLDKFKSINDTFGHPAGDSVIQGLAQLLRDEGRQSDVPCRYGGEEFAIIMPETAPEDAVHLCDRIREKLERLKWSRHPERAVTCSVGIAGSSTLVDVSADQWVEVADRNLYTAKQTGRNKVVSAVIGGEAEPLAAAG